MRATQTHSVARLEPNSEYAHQLCGVRCVRKMKCEVFLSTPSVGYSGSPSTANETTVKKNEWTSHELHQKGHLKISYELTSNSIQTCPTTMCACRKMPSPVMFLRNGFCNLFA